ncbi:AEC family transporter [Pararhodospirillum photometricum]|uniref:Auxin Efflux Carrier n=1 Tax=Pararhodospirillum photometricum DSM 122 TaxID=1150469 RepID=H6SPC2_PARPM|nr:AEC family transporter [Pararhodospirillum photometricum]CCG09447.1 Auxin Efflux Carrier [Pararhodospirillum photometricum DSM 122]
MTPSLSAIVAVFLVILLGTGLRRLRLIPDTFWAPAEALTYYVTFPALLVANLANASLDGVPWERLAVLEALGVGVGAAVLLACRPWLARRGMEDPGFTSVFQGAIRPNTYIGLAVAAALFGPQGVTLTALCIAVVVPLVNVLAVSCMVRFGRGQRATLRGFLRGLATNPLILGCVVGLALQVTQTRLPPVVGGFLQMLASAALPLGLLAVGAGLSVRALGGALVPLGLSSAVKMLLTPAVVGAAGWALGLEGAVLAVAVLYAALPCSASAYVLARQMGGDAPMMAAIITGQTAAAAVVLPLILAVIAP